MAEIALWKMLRCHHVVIKNKKITKWQSPSAPNEQKKGITKRESNQGLTAPKKHKEITKLLVLPCV